MLRSVMTFCMALAFVAFFMPTTASASADHVVGASAIPLASGRVIAGAGGGTNPCIRNEDAAGPAVPEPSGLLAFAAGALVLRSRLRRR